MDNTVDVISAIDSGVAVMVAIVAIVSMGKTMSLQREYHNKLTERMLEVIVKLCDRDCDKKKN